MNNNKLNITGKIAKVFLDNPYIVVLLIIFLFFIGILSFLITPKEENPQIVVPAAYVITQWPGSSATEVELRISKVLEDKILDIKGVEDVYSVSGNSLSMVTVKFFVGENKEDSFEKLYDKLQANRDLLPSNASIPIVKPIDTDDVPIVVLTFTSDKYSIESLKDIAQKVGDNLKIIDGTSNIDTIGGYDRRLNIYIDPMKLESYNLSLTDVVNTLKFSNLYYPLGDSDIGIENYKIEFDNHYKNINEIKDQVVAVKGERQVLLSDIAEVTDNYEEKKTFTYFGEKGDTKIREQVSLSIAKKKGENAVTLSNDIIKKLDKIKSGIIPPEVQVSVTRNSGEVALDAVLSLLNNLWQAILIVVLILFLFLGMRESLIVAISIPLTISVVFILGFLFNQSINRITLFALILSLGMLVDSSIVIVENISRHLKMGDRDSGDTVSEAVSEVGFGLVASTVTTIFAFYPMAFVTGMMGPYMRPIPFNTPNALIVALLLSFTVTPYLAMKILSPKFGRKNNLSNTNNIEEDSRYKILYQNILRKILYSKKLSKLILISVIAIFSLVLIFPIVPVVRNYFDAPKFLDFLPALEFKMLPKADKNTLSIFIDYPFGTNIKETKKRTKYFTDYLLQNKYIENFSVFEGINSVVDFNGLLKGSNMRTNPNQVTITINLQNKDERKITSKEIAWKLRADLEDIALKTQANYKIIEDPPGPPVRSTVLGRLYGKNPEEMGKASLELKNILDGVKGIKDTDMTINDNQFKYLINIDRRKADLLGVSNEELFNNLKLAVDGFSPTILHQDKDEDEVKIWVQVDPTKKESLDYLNHLNIKTSTGEYVPFSEIAHINYEEEEKLIYHENQEPLSYVYGETEKVSQIYSILEVMKKIRTNKFLKDINIDWGGEWELTMDVFRDLGLAMFVGLFFIYFVLVVQFKSFHIPFLILGTLPLALIGIIPGFVLIGLQFNATSMIGTIALSGIVVNNAIIMLEYIENLKQKGLSLIETVIEAVGTRMRPILLTSATTMLGSLTIALGDEVWAGLGWAIIWGILVSTLLTLFIFPVMYVLSESRD